MFSSFYEQYISAKTLKEYPNNICAIEKINKELKEEISNHISSGLKDYFYQLSSFILKTLKQADSISREYLCNCTIDELLYQNHDIYSEISPENYLKSYTNPEYSTTVFGTQYGAMMSAVFSLYVNYIDYSFKNKKYRINELNKLFIELYTLASNDRVEYDAIQEKVISNIHSVIDREAEVNLREDMCPEHRFYTEIIENSDLTDLSYLFQYGKYISINEIETARAFLEYPQELIDRLSDTIARAYMHGFISQNKNPGRRKLVRLHCVAGQERIVKSLINTFKSYGFSTHVFGVSATSINKQYEYDHRFDYGLYINEHYADKFVKAFGDAAKKYKVSMENVSGGCNIIKFGEATYNLKNKESCLGLSMEQRYIYMSQNSKTNQIIDNYIPRSEISFCAVGFPSYEIGENFKDVLDEFIALNMVNSSDYEIIQQEIINALDKGEFVHVKGKEGNLTDIRVKMKKIEKPEKETNFLNCGADLNIPYGEVFTTPELNGTNGTLHFREVLLKGLKYINLILKFQDGYVSEYSCSNFNNEVENKKYIFENLLNNNNIIPMGEFAIGTNTRVYALAKEYNIMDKLPILITEKMGPHFAIGDPCYSHAEENPIYNLLDGKEITAKENEKTMKRKTSISEAYTGIHTDITLPYEDISFLKVIPVEGAEFDIIRDGSFVLPGIEKLNQPLLGEVIEDVWYLQ